MRVHVGETHGGGDERQREDDRATMTNEQSLHMTVERYETRNLRVLVLL